MRSFACVSFGLSALGINLIRQLGRDLVDLYWSQKADFQPVLRY